MRRAVIVALLLLAGCTSESANRDDGTLQVVASFKPLAEIVEAVAGDAVRVTTLTPPGVEPHDVELSPDDVDRLEDADLVVYLGDDFQPAVEDVAERLDDDQVLDVGAELDLDGDPHFWLDPAMVVSVAEAVAERLDGDARPLVDDLEDLATEIGRGLSNCETRVLVTAHDAFGHLAEAYDLETEPITGVSPESEPDPKRLAELADIVQETKTTTIFTEELLSPEVAETLARETGASTAVLDPLEASESAYFDGMRANLEVLRKGLRCT